MKAATRRACQLPMDLITIGECQLAERKFQFSQRIREVCLDLGFTVTILSRLPLVMHDPDRLQAGH